MKHSWYVVAPFLAVCIAFAFVATGCNDDDDDGGTTVVVTEEAEGTPTTASAQQLANGTKTVSSGDRVVSKIVPADGTVSASASWTLPGLAGTVILNASGGSARGSATGVGGASTSGAFTSGENAVLVVEFSGGGTIDVTYTMSYEP